MKKNETKKQRSYYTPQRQQQQASQCAWPDCVQPGVYKAPKSRDDLYNYYWFCLEHVQAYNSTWNYHAGLDDAAVEQQYRADMVWEKPTWPLGSQTPKWRDWFVDDAIERFFADRKRRKERKNSVQPDISNAFQTLEMDPDMNIAHVKKQYRALVKKYHPDANGGSLESHDKIKQINEAFEKLEKFLKGASRPQSE